MTSKPARRFSRATSARPNPTQALPVSPASATKHGVAALLCALGAAAAAPAVADGYLTPYAAEDIEHNTNVFDLPSSSELPVGKHGPTLADTFYETRVGAEGQYLIDQDKFFGTAELRHFIYDNFTVLNHNEELVDGGLKWKSGNAVDGQLEYRHEQRMVQFQDLQASTQLILETENTATGSLNVNVTPEWRVESKLQDHLLDSPRVDVPGLSLHEDSITEGLKYLGVANLSAGFQASYLDGEYRHDPLALDPYYHQITGGLAANYVVSGLTNFSGTVGYTHRTDPTNAGLSGVTGALGYQHSLSAKTSVNLTLSRALNSYLTTGGNEIDTTAGATLNYQLTYKMLLRLGYSYTDSKFPGTPVGTEVIDRVDHYQIANLDLTYQFLHWLSVRPYVRYQSRHSNDDVYTFQGNIVGVEILAKQIRPNP
jgi:hypothetical protein